MAEHPRTVIWLSSYPKSGNTWVRFMLLNLIFGPQNSTAQLDTLIPDIHKSSKQLRLPEESNVLIKTHYLLSESMPLFARTAGFIYIVRNPMDVMISNLHYAFTKTETANDPAIRETIQRQYIEQFIRYRGEPNWIRLGRGTWEEHVRSWVASNHRLPNIVVRYEDLLADPVAQLSRISKFINLPKAKSELQAAVNNSSFATMKTIEEKELAQKQIGFFLSETSDKSISEGNRFMHRGRSGEGEKALSPDQRDRFIKNFGRTMESLGYET